MTNKKKRKDRSQLPALIIITKLTKSSPVLQNLLQNGRHEIVVVQEKVTAIFDDFDEQLSTILHLL